MKDIHIMILGAAAVQEDAVIAAHEQQWHVSVCARSDDGPAAAAADEFYPIDLLDVDALEKVARHQQVDAIYSVGSDLAMPVVGQLTDRLGLPVFANFETAISCNNKAKMRHCLQGLTGNIDYQIVATGGQVGPDVEFPCIVKPVDSQGQRGVTLVSDRGQLLSALALAQSHSRSGTAIIERYIGGVEVSVNGYLVDGELKFMLISDRVTWPQFTGLIWKHVIAPQDQVSTVIHDRVEALLTQACQRIGLSNGPVYAQVKIEDGFPFLVEVTPRLDGCHMWQLIRAACGVDLLAATLDHLVCGVAPDFPAAITVNHMELEFHCQEPNTPANYADQPSDGAIIRRYYAPGQQIRPINGRFEKIGYTIRSNSQAARL